MLYNNRTNPKALFYIGLAFIVIGGGCLVAEPFAHADYELYKNHGVDGTAVVVDKRAKHYTDTNGNPNTDYSVTVDFSCPTLQHFKDERLISETDFNDCTVGKTIVVRYLPDNPKRFKFKSDAQETGSALFWFAGIFGILGMFFAGLGRYLDRKQAQLATLSATVGDGAQ